MKKQEILNYLAAAVVLMLAIGHVYAVVKGKVTPVRAGISTHTTYGAISTEETLTLGEPAKVRRATVGANGVTAEKPIIIYGFYLEGRSCRISANADGSTKVEVDMGNNNWEEAAVENENGKTVDWSQVIIFPGYHHEKKEGGNNLQTAPSIGEVNITMTGGKVYGIYGAGTTDTDELFTGSVEGNVTVTITGGEVHELSNLGTCAVKQGENQTGYLFGNYNLIMTGGRYTGNTLQAIRSRVDSNVATHVSYITTSTAIIANVDFDFKEAIDALYNRKSGGNFELTGMLVQDARCKNYLAVGDFTIPSTVELQLPNLYVDYGNIANYGKVEVTGCAQGDLYVNGQSPVSPNSITQTGTHDWVDVVETPATCLSDGTKKRVCKKCFTEEVRINIPATDHTWGTIPAHPATCRDKGYESYEGCTFCGTPKDGVMITTIPRKGHTYVEDATYKCEDNCNLAGGDVKKKVCSACGGVVFEGGDHVFGDWDYIPGSVDDIHPNGLEQRTCGKCQEAEVKDHSHSLGWGNGMPASCQEDGYAACKVCPGCMNGNDYTTFAFEYMQGDTVNVFVKPTIPRLDHAFVLKDENRDALYADYNCEHGLLFYLTCAHDYCGVWSTSPQEVWENGDPNPHNFSKVVSIRPDANFAEAGCMKLQCEECSKQVDFDYNIYTEGSISKNTPRNPTSLYTETSLNKAGEHDKEATCITGRTPRHVSLYNGQSSNPTLLAENLDVSAVLSVVKGKHAWDADGHCRNCGESDEAYIRRQVTIQPDESSVVLPEELFETYQTLDGDNQTKWQESVMNANETEDIRVGVFCDVEWKDEMTVNKDVEFALNGHTMNVPSGIVQENQSAIKVTSGTLTTPSVTGDGPKTVDRDQGASFVIDMSDDVPYSQNTQVSGVDARYARTFEVANVWQAMSVPFAVMPDAETLIGCDIAAVYFQSNPDGVELIIRKVAVDERLYANRAYLVCPKNTGKYNFTAANVTVEDAIESADNDFVCTPTTVPCQGEIFLGYDDDKQPVLVRNNNEGVQMKPFRWYVNSDALQKRLKDVPNDVRRKVQGPNGKEGYYLGKVTLTVDKSIDVVDAANLIGMLTGDKAMNVAADADNNGVTNAEDVKKVVNIILGADDAIFITTEDKVLRVPATIKSIPAVDQVPL